MSLKDRLTRLTGNTSKPESADPKQDRSGELRRRLDRVINRPGQTIRRCVPTTQRHMTPLEDIVAGEEVETLHGRFFISRCTLETHGVHGHARVGDLSDVNMEAAAFLAGFQFSKDTLLSDGLFLDTETTGLMGGTGTFPFLIGLGWFEADTFVTCQLFARDFSEECAVLKHLSEVASGKQFLVTFNGKAYDLNLLTARFILNRCKDTLTGMAHIDLLHPSRRILSHRLENARLSTIETQVLGVEREGDVPGFEIPQRYFDWLRQRDGRLLQDVFAHNRLDIVSMASLLKYLTDLVENNHETRRNHHGDLLRLAGLVHERGDLRKAERMFEALTTSYYKDVALSAQEALSLIYKKARRWEEAAEIWQNLVASNPRNFFAVQELAKYYEHHTRERARALQLVRELLNGGGCHLSDPERASAEYRLRRLLHKASSR